MDKNNNKTSLICLQIDLARQKENLTYIKEYFSNAKRWGYNSVLLYLENMVRTPSTSFFSVQDTYSTSEMQEIVSYAKTLDLIVIPAFENLAHLEKFFAYPNLRDLTESLNEKEEGRGFSREEYANCGCVSNERLYEVMDTYITEVASIFDGEYIHMGLDEPFDFAICQKCKQRLSQGESKSDMFYKHVMHTYQLVKSLGKRMMMWDDFFEYADITYRLPKDIILCNWNYSFVGVEPQGHWTNRIKKDWFRLYDELGFDYMFCTYAHCSSSTYNLESFTRYAKKYNPIGGLCTAWEHFDSFYLSSYPIMAYAAKLWNGKIHSYNDILEIYEQEIGNRELAKLVLSLNIPAFGINYLDIDKICENECYIRFEQKKQLEYVVEKMRENLSNDVSLDIYDNVYEYLLNLQLATLGDDFYNQIEGKNKDCSKILTKLEEIKNGFEEIEKNLHKLWNKYRQGIFSSNDSLNKKFASIKERLERIKSFFQQETSCGILYFDTMLHDGYCTAKAQIKVKYNWEKEEFSLYNGGLKSFLVGYDAGGCYSFRFRMENKDIEYLTLTVYGEGSLYPLNLRYLVNGVTYIASEVQVVSGKVLNKDNLLYNDSQFAEMGTSDGIAHFNNIALSKEKHTVKIYFKKFV